MTSMKKLLCALLMVLIGFVAFAQGKSEKVVLTFWDENAGDSRTPSTKEFLPQRQKRNMMSPSLQKRLLTSVMPTPHGVPIGWRKNASSLWMDILMHGRKASTSTGITFN